jgi:hypothetical protein
VSIAQRVSQEVGALQGLDLEGLRVVWRERWGVPPKLRSPDLLRHAIAWRMQAAAFGELDADTARQLRLKKMPTGHAPLTPGTRLAREWKGALCEVEVVDEGFRYRGDVYRSLSQIARIITGTRWNGRRFFGLTRDDGP